MIIYPIVILTLMMLHPGFILKNITHETLPCTVEATPNYNVGN